MFHHKDIAQQIHNFVETTVTHLIILYSITGLDSAIYWTIIVKGNTWEEYITLNISNLQSTQTYFHVISISSSYNDWWFLKTYRSTGDDYMMATPYKNIFRDWKYGSNGGELFGFF